MTEQKIPISSFKIVGSGISIMMSDGQFKFYSARDKTITFFTTEEKGQKYIILRTKNEKA